MLYKGIDVNSRTDHLCIAALGKAKARVFHTRRLHVTVHLWC